MAVPCEQLPTQNRDLRERTDDISITRKSTAPYRYVYFGCEP